MSSEDSAKRAGVLRMAKRLHENAKKNGGTMTYEQGQKIAKDAFKRNDRKGE